jgi:hypothetical protein
MPSTGKGQGDDQVTEEVKRRLWHSKGIEALISLSCKTIQLTGIQHLCSNLLGNLHNV